MLPKRKNLKTYRAYRPPHSPAVRWESYRLGYSFSIRTGIDSRYLNRRRCNLRKLRHRQYIKCDQTGYHNEQASTVAKIGRLMKNLENIIYKFTINIYIRTNSYLHRLKITNKPTASGYRLYLHSISDLHQSFCNISFLW